MKGGRKKFKGEEKDTKYVTFKWTMFISRKKINKLTKKLHEKRSRFILRLDLLKIEFSKRWVEVPVMGHMMIGGEGGRYRILELEFQIPAHFPSSMYRDHFPKCAQWSQQLRLYRFGRTWRY